jgi:hypothetical protein
MKGRTTSLSLSPFRYLSELKLLHNRREERGDSSAAAINS